MNNDFDYTRPIPREEQDRAYANALRQEVEELVPLPEPLFY